MWERQSGKHNDEDKGEDDNNGIRRHRLGIRGREFLEAAQHDFLKDLLLVTEVLVGRGSRDPGAAAGVGQCEAVRPMLDQQLTRGGNQRLAEVTMVEPLFSAHGGSMLCLGHNFFPR